MLRSQVYSLVKDGTTADRELDELRCHIPAVLSLSILSSPVKLSQPHLQVLEAGLSDQYAQVWTANMWWLPYKRSLSVFDAHIVHRPSYHKFGLAMYATRMLRSQLM